MKLFIRTLLLSCSIASGMELTIKLPRRTSESSKPIKHKQFIEKVRDHLKEQEKVLLEMIESAIETPGKLRPLVNDLEKPLPSFDPQKSPFIVQESTDNDCTSRRIVINPTWEQEYYKHLSIEKSKRIHSGNYGQVEDLGFMAQLEEKLNQHSKMISPEQHRFLAKLFGLYFKSNYRTSKTAPNFWIEEKRKVRLAFESCEKLLKDKERINALLPNEAGSPLQSPRSESSTSTDLQTAMAQHSSSEVADRIIALRASKKHARQRSQSFNGQTKNHF